MALGETLFRVQKALKVNQKRLAEILQCSPRTVIRYYQRGGFLLPSKYEKLATLCHPHDRALAAELAARAGKTLIDLGLERPPPPPLPPPAPAPPPRPAHAPRHLVDSIVCAAAEAMQSPPHAMRPALTAAFERAIALGMTAEDVLKGMAAEPMAKAKGKGSAA